jgi:hypothetical protein
MRSVHFVALNCDRYRLDANLPYALRGHNAPVSAACSRMAEAAPPKAHVSKLSDD